MYSQIQWASTGYPEGVTTLLGAYNVPCAMYNVQCTMLQSMCTYNVKNDQDSSFGMYVLKWIGAKRTSHNLNYFLTKQVCTTR